MGVKELAEDMSGGEFLELAHRDAGDELRQKIGTFPPAMSVASRIGGDIVV